MIINNRDFYKLIDDIKRLIEEIPPKCRKNNYYIDSAVMTITELLYKYQKQLKLTDKDISSTLKYIGRGLE